MTDLDIPMGEADEATRTLLAELAERYYLCPSRPCCDAETTLRDWRDAGLWPNDEGSALIAYALLLVMPVIFLALLLGSAASLVGGA